MKHFFYQLLSILTRLVNVLAFMGSAHFTTSARAYSEGIGGGFWGRFRVLIDWLFSPIEQEHCKRVWDGRVARAYETISRDEEIREILAMRERSK